MNPIAERIHKKKEQFGMLQHLILEQIVSVCIVHMK